MIPRDPNFVPETSRQQLARDRFAVIAPDADEIEIILSEGIRFFDCGGNFERVRCPACDAEVPTDWWQDRMTEDYGEGFRLASYTMPCCGQQHGLHQLIYEWPQGFGRFALDAMNPNIGMLEESLLREFEELLGTPLLVIYQHI